MNNLNCVPGVKTSNNMCECQYNECSKVGSQYIDISIPMEIKPKAVVGKIETICCGEPTIVCKENKCRNFCEIILTQKVCLKIPIHYNVSADIGESLIDCECKKQ